MSMLDILLTKTKKSLFKKIKKNIEKFPQKYLN